MAPRRRMLTTGCGEWRSAIPGPAGFAVMVVAAIGVAVNSVTAMLFFSGRNRDLNIRGAYLHMAADAAVSLGVVISGALIRRYGLVWMDPMISLVIAAVILLSTWGLLRDSLNLAVDAVPRAVDPQAVRGFLDGLEGVHELHDLHIWAMSTTDTALTAHLVMDPLPADDRFLYEVSCELDQRFGIHHATIQIERHESQLECRQAVHCAD